jgi:hypothetical protein
MNNNTLWPESKLIVYFLKKFDLVERNPLFEISPYSFAI